MFTSHGHHIIGTVLGPMPESVARCGGPGLCAQCSEEAERAKRPTPHPTKENKMETLEFRTFRRKPFFVREVLVTEENLEEVAKWVDGEIELTEKGDRFVRMKVHRPATERQTKAFPRDHVLEMGGAGSKQFKIYTPKAFENNFEAVTE